MNNVDMSHQVVQDKQRGVDTSQLNDPIASKTDWRPLKSGGSKLLTRTLKAAQSHRREFKIGMPLLLFSLAFVLVGIAVALGWNSGESSIGESDTESILAGIVFMAIGGLMIYFNSKPIVFDKKTGYFRKGSSRQKQIGSRKKNVCKIQDIHAIQIIGEYVRASKSSYTSYELNLVLKDASRINVVDHSNYYHLLSDARDLSSFLGVPIWDSVNR